MHFRRVHLPLMAVVTIAIVATSVLYLVYST
jgi:hypothetical protein